MRDSSLNDAIVERVVEHYLASGDYNGLPIERLARDMSIADSAVVTAVAGLVERGRLTLTSERTDLNPYVRRLPPAAIDVQLESLRSGAERVLSSSHVRWVFLWILTSHCGDDSEGDRTNSIANELRHR